MTTLLPESIQGLNFSLGIQTKSKLWSLIKNAFKNFVSNILPNQNYQQSRQRYVIYIFDYQLDHSEND